MTAASTAIVKMPSVEGSGMTPMKRTFSMSNRSAPVVEFGASS
jgi:hypothetical protein